MKDSVLIRVDKETHERLKEAASGMPVAAYIRDFAGNLSIDERLAAIEETLKKLVPDETIPDEKDIRQEARELGKKLGYGKKRMKALEIMLEKGSDQGIASAVKHMRDRVAHPERDNEFYRREFIGDMAVRFKSTPETVVNVANAMVQFEEYLADIHPNIARYVREYVYNKIRSFDVDSMSDDERISLDDWTREALDKYTDEHGFKQPK